jgi:4-amino-4-deoxy-L-arabinose transferase-like glycosyltransferase
MLLVLAAAWLITRIARRWSTDPIMVVAPQLLFLFHPGTVLSQTRGGVEPLFALLLTLFVLMVYRAIDSNRFVDFAVGGVVLGLAAIVKSTPMLFPVFLFAYLVVFERRLGSPFAIALRILVMVAAMTAVLSPWIVRNYRLTGRFVPSASVLGISAHAGQYICVNLPSGDAWVDLDRKAARERTSVARTLGYPFKDVEDGYYQSFYSSTDELSFSSYLLGRVVDTYRQSPALFARCSSANLLNFWFAGKTWKSTALNVVVQLPYLVLAVVGISIAFRRHMGLAIAPCLLFVVYYVAVYVPILAQARYSIPIIPFLSVFAGVALAATRQRLAGRQRVGGWDFDRLPSEGEV